MLARQSHGMGRVGLNEQWIRQMDRRNLVQEESTLCHKATNPLSRQSRPRL